MNPIPTSAHLGPTGWRSAGCVALAVLVVACSTYDAALLSGKASDGDDPAGGSAGAPADGGEASGGTTSAGSSAGSSSSAGTPAVGGASAGGSDSPGGGDSGSSAGAGGAGEPEPGVLPAGEGTISYERWDDILGVRVSDIPVKEPPDFMAEVRSFMVPASGDDWGARLRGFITAPLDGNYRFWIACDDNGELWLSSDEQQANQQLIAYVHDDRYTNAGEWTKYASQESGLVALEAGKRYRVEALVKQGGGSSHLSVGWLKPGESGAEPSEIVPGRQLSPIGAAPSP